MQDEELIAHRAAAAARRRLEAPGVAVGVTEDVIRAQVHAFYGRVRADPMLGPIFEAKIDDVGYDALTVVVAGPPEKLDAMTDLLQPFGIIELQRTGRVALPKLARRPAKLRAVRTRTG